MIEILRPDWPQPPGIAAGTSTRRGGISTGVYRSLNLGAHVGDAPGAVRENRRRFRQAAALQAEPRWLGQVHGTAVLDAASIDSDAPPPADAAFSSAAGVACAVLTADCLPVLLCSRDGAVVAAAHAGWRGLAAGILVQTVTAMPVQPGQLMAWLGPAIGAGAYEVGDEVREAFTVRDAGLSVAFRPNARGRWQADLYVLARASLAQAGVRAVYGGDCCTASEPLRFFSYRRDGPCGRMASFIVRQA